MNLQGFLTSEQGRSQDFSKGAHSRDTIRGSPTIYGLYRCSPSCISGLSRIIAAWRSILTKDEPLTKILYKKPNFKKVGFSTMAFTAKILSWRFRHLNIVGCLLKRRPTKGGSRAPQDSPPLATPLIYMCLAALFADSRINGGAKKLIKYPFVYFSVH